MALIFRVGAVSLALLHLVKVFFPSVPDWLVSVASIALLIPGLVLMSSGFKKATVVFIVLGFGLLAFTRQPMSAWIAAWNSMTNMAAIMVAMQIISIPVFMGQYDTAIRLWAEKRFRSESSLFLFSTMITHVLASILMLGAIPLSMNLLGCTVNSRIRQHDRFLATAASRGYVLSHLWAPGAINLYLVVQATGVSWSSILIPGLILASLGLGLSYRMETNQKGVLGGDRDDDILPSKSAVEVNSPAADSLAIYHVLIVAFAIVAIVLILERLKIGVGYIRIMLGELLVGRASQSPGYGTFFCRHGHLFRGYGIIGFVEAGNSNNPDGFRLVWRFGHRRSPSDHHRSFSRRSSSFHHDRSLRNDSVKGGDSPPSADDSPKPRRGGSRLLYDLSLRRHNNEHCAIHRRQGLRYRDTLELEIQSRLFLPRSRFLLFFGRRLRVSDKGRLHQGGGAAGSDPVSAFTLPSSINVGFRYSSFFASSRFSTTFFSFIFNTSFP